jgi:hypothetical protein
MAIYCKLPIKTIHTFNDNCIPGRFFSFLPSSGFLSRGACYDLFIQFSTKGLVVKIKYLYQMMKDLCFLSYLGGALGGDALICLRNYSKLNFHAYSGCNSTTLQPHDVKLFTINEFIKNFYFLIKRAHN